MPEPGVTLDRQYVEQQLVPDAVHAGFSERHGDLVRDTREVILGSVATLGELDESDPRNIAKRIEYIYTIAREQHRGDLNGYNAAVGLDNYLNNTTWQYPGEKKAPHQKEALHKTLDMLGKGERLGYIEHATGLGKTYIEAKLAEAFHKAGLRVLILAPRVSIAGDNIVGDALGEEELKGLTKFAPDINREDIGEHFGGKKATKDHGVVVSTYQSLNRFAQSGELGEFDVIIADEGHAGLGETTRQTLEQFSPHAVKIALTATAEYDEEKSLAKLFPYRIDKIDLREAVDDGLTAPIHALLVETGAQINVVNPYREFSDLELRRLRNLKSRNEQALKFASDFVSDGRQGVISCVPGNDIEHARLMAESLSEQIVEVTAIDEETGEVIIDEETGKAKKIRRNIVAKTIGGTEQTDEEQRQIRVDFEAGRIDILTYVNAIGLGWDSRKASFLISLCPTTSLLRKTQEIGRVIRQKEDGQHSIVVDFVDEVVGKIQQTALHALGEEEISYKKIYGQHQFLGDEGPSTYLHKLLRRELYERLETMEGRLLGELVLPREGRVYRKDYAKKLDREGLVEDPHVILAPEIIAGIEEIELEYWDYEGRAPTDHELINHLVQRKIVKSLGNITAEEAAFRALRAREAVYGDHGILPDTVEFERDAWPLIPTDLTDYKSLQDEVIPGLLSGLDEREQLIIRLRFGLTKDGKEDSLEEVGAKLNLTRERIRQLEARALAKLRHPQALIPLGLYGDDSPVDWL